MDEDYDEMMNRARDLSASAADMFEQAAFLRDQARERKREANDLVYAAWGMRHKQALANVRLTGDGDD